jgi:hypothetical protein
MWQSGLGSANVGSATDWSSQVSSRSHSGHGGSARSRTRSRRFAKPVRHQSDGSSKRSKARDSARRSVTGFCSASARVRSTARSLSVEDEPAPACALSRSSRTTASSRASFRPFRSNSIIVARNPGEPYPVPDAPTPSKKARWCGPFYGGASRARTGDLLGAIQALSQLSYSPARANCS